MEKKLVSWKEFKEDEELQFKAWAKSIPLFELDRAMLSMSDSSINVGMVLGNEELVVSGRYFSIIVFYNLPEHHLAQWSSGWHMTHNGQDLMELINKE